MPASTPDPSQRLSNPRHELVAHEYLKDRNAAKAYQRIYGCNDRAAETHGPALVRKRQVRARINFLLAQLTAKLMAETEITTKRVLQEYAAVAFTRITDYVDITPQGVTVKDLTGVDTRAIAEAVHVDTEDGPRVKLKMHNKIQALHDLADHLGLFDRPETPRTEGDFVIVYSPPAGTPPPKRVALAIEL